MNDTTPTILVVPPLDEQWLAHLRTIAPGYRVERAPSEKIDELPAGLLREVEVLYTTSAVPTPEQAPRLRWVHLHSAGVDHVVDQPLFQEAIRFTSSSGIHAINMAEYVFAMLLAWNHRVPRLLAWQREQQWPAGEARFPDSAPRELWGRTIAIAGYGSIGRQVARLAKGFGMRVLAMQRSDRRRHDGFPFEGVGDPDGALPDRYYRPDALHEMLRESDVVVIIVPLTGATRQMFDEAAFRAMKEDAFLVNIARGAVCDEAALVRALEERWIGGAALDVFAEEPLPADHRLWTLPNVLLSPHLAGHTPRYNERAARIFEANLRRYLTGEPMYNEIDKSQGY